MFTSENARLNQTKGAETKRLRKENVAALARDVILKALHEKDTRVALEVARELGLFKQMVATDGSSERAIAGIGALLDGAPQRGDGPTETQAAAKAGGGEKLDTVSDKIFPKSDKIFSEQGDEESDE
jgi:hypothetical protein